MTSGNMTDDVKPVEERNRLDEAALEAWMLAHVPDYQGPLSLVQFKGGQSNPTYRIDSPSGSYVLRRKPFGQLLPSAHAVDREFRVSSALHAQGFAVARQYALCMDDKVLGSAFYVMECVQGRLLWDGALPDFSKDQRRALYISMTSTLAQLHNFDPAAIGLGDYGKPGNYIGRQIDRWSKQYRASQTDEIPEMDNLIAYLPGSVPEQMRVSIVHGDYRLDNTIMHPTEPRVLAVLDWELSTLGEPLADFSNFLMNWVNPIDGRAALFGHDLSALGIPGMEEIAGLYCTLTKRDVLPPLDWLFAYNLFRLSAIYQGIGGRIRDGTAAHPDAAKYAEAAPELARRAWEFAKKAGA